MEIIKNMVEIGKLIILLFMLCNFISCKSSNKPKIDNAKNEVYIDSISFYVFQDEIKDTLILNKFIKKLGIFEKRNSKLMYNDLKYFIFCRQYCYDGDLIVFFEGRDNFHFLSPDLLYTSETIVNDTFGYFKFNGKDFFIHTDKVPCKSQYFKIDNIEKKKIEIIKIAGYKSHKNNEWSPILSNYYYQKFLFDGATLRYLDDDDINFPSYTK